jgi:hypothetical protein
MHLKLGFIVMKREPKHRVRIIVKASCSSGNECLSFAKDVSAAIPLIMPAESLVVSYQAHWFMLVKQS